MFGAGRHSEIDTLVGYLDAQITAVRAAAYGLTDEQARQTPCRSTLSIGGLVKHTTWVMQQRVAEQRTPLDETGFNLYMGSFSLDKDETLESVLAAFDDARTAYLANVRGTDPGGDQVSPPAPWDSVFEPTDSVQRFELVHHVEEFARHAGHADIIREQLDGAGSGPLLLALEGRPGNDFVQPWTPQSD